MFNKEKFEGLKEDFIQSYQGLKEGGRMFIGPDISESQMNAIFDLMEDVGLSYKYCDKILVKEDGYTVIIHK